MSHHHNGETEGMQPLTKNQITVNKNLDVFYDHLVSQDFTSLTDRFSGYLVQNVIMTMTLISMHIQMMNTFKPFDLSKGTKEEFIEHFKIRVSK